MLRLAPPDFERFLQSPNSSPLSAAAKPTSPSRSPASASRHRYVTVLPEKPIADAIIAELRRFGVDTSQIVRGHGRMGIYFVETGANQRASQSRLRPRVQLHRPRQTRRHRLGRHLRRRRLVPHHRHHARHQRHPPPTSPLECVQKPARKGLTVSCDLNYRKNLWKWGKPAPRSHERTREASSTSSSPTKKIARWPSAFKPKSTSTPANSITRNMKTHRRPSSKNIPT